MQHSKEKNGFQRWFRSLNTIKDQQVLIFLLSLFARRNLNKKKWNCFQWTHDIASLTSSSQNFSWWKYLKFRNISKMFATYFYCYRRAVFLGGVDESFPPLHLDPVHCRCRTLSLSLDPVASVEASHASVTLNNIFIKCIHKYNT